MHAKFYAPVFFRRREIRNRTNKQNDRQTRSKLSIPHTTAWWDNNDENIFSLAETKRQKIDEGECDWMMPDALAYPERGTVRTTDRQNDQIITLYYTRQHDAVRLALN